MFGFFRRKQSIKETDEERKVNQHLESLKAELEGVSEQGKRNRLESLRVEFEVWERRLKTLDDEALKLVASGATSAEKIIMDLRSNSEPPVTLAAYARVIVRRYEEKSKEDWHHLVMLGAQIVATMEETAVLEGTYMNPVSRRAGEFVAYFEMIDKWPETIVADKPWDK